MTMYECENELQEGSTSVDEMDCFYSTQPEISTRSHQSSGVKRPQLVSHTHMTNGAQHTDMIHGVSTDIQDTVDSICEQLDSCDLVNNRMESESAARKQDGDTVVTNGAQQGLPTFEEAFAQDKDGDTTLHMAIIYMKSVLAIMLINICPSYTWLNLRNHLYQTALHLAVLTKQLPVVRRLIVGGADVAARDHHGNTPLHIACRDGFLEGAKALMEPVRYAETKLNQYDIPYQRIPQNLEITNYEGVTALHLAASNRHYDIVKLLIDKRADVNSRDVKSGRSILHKACADGDLTLVRIMLKCKECDINLRTYDDFTPFDLARARSYERVTFELAVAGARYADEHEEYN